MRASYLFIFHPRATRSDHFSADILDRNSSAIKQSQQHLNSNVVTSDATTDVIV